MRGGNLKPAPVWRTSLALLSLMGLGLLMAPGMTRASGGGASWQNADVDTALSALGYSLEEAIRLHRLTAYNPVARQTDHHPDLSSCGPNRPDQLALSRDLFFNEEGRKHLCGAKVMLLVVDPQTSTVESVQERVVWDTMHRRYEETGDVYLDTKDESVAYEFGVKQGVIVFVSEN